MIISCNQESWGLKQVFGFAQYQRRMCSFLEFEGSPLNSTLFLWCICFFIKKILICITMWELHLTVLHYNNINIYSSNMFKYVLHESYKVWYKNIFDQCNGPEPVLIKYQSQFVFIFGIRLYNQRIAFLVPQPLQFVTFPILFSTFPF